MKKIGLLIAALCMLFYSTIIAQPERGNGNRKEMREFVKNEVLPVLQVQREKLEAHLSASEKENLAAIREQLKAGKKEGIKELHTKAKENPEGLTDKEKVALMDARLEKRRLLGEVREIAENHREELEALKKQIAPELEAWTEKMESFKLEKRENRSQSEETGERSGKRERGGKGRKLGNLKHLLSPVGFLLWDGSLRDLNQGERGEGIATMAYPNPANGEATIKFWVSEDGLVKINLVDQQGVHAMNLLERELKSGEHSISVDTSQLPEGQYFYKVETVNGFKTKRLSVTK